MSPLLFVLIGLTLVGLVGYLSYRAEQKRRQVLSALALARGWAFSVHDTYGLAHRWSKHPFGRGDARRASNVITGEVAGRPLVSFDYRYEETSTDSKGNSSTTTYRFTVTVLRLPAALTGLELRSENLLSRIGNALGFDDVELESEDFNRRFRVGCANAKFAHDVLTPRQMELLLASDCPNLRLDGHDLLAWSTGRAEPAEVLARVALLQAFADGVPSFVWKDHGHTVPPAGGSGDGLPWVP